MLAKGNLEVIVALPSEREIRFTSFFRRSRQILYATRFCQLRDRFGVLWSIIHERTMA
jgi:hypothetical protein